MNNLFKSNKYHHIMDDIEDAKNKCNKYRQNKIDEIENIINTNIQSDEFKESAKNGNINISVYNQPHMDQLNCTEIVDLLNKKDNYPIKFYRKPTTGACQIYIKLIDID